MTRYWQPDEDGGYSDAMKREIALSALRDDVGGYAFDALDAVLHEAWMHKNESVRNAVVSVVSGNSQDRERVGDLLHEAMVQALIADYDKRDDDHPNLNQWDRIAADYADYIKDDEPMCNEPRIAA